MRDNFLTLMYNNNPDSPIDDHGRLFCVHSVVPGGRQGHETEILLLVGGLEFGEVHVSGLGYEGVCSAGKQPGRSSEF